MAYLSLKDINKIYPNGFHAVHDFNMEAEKGEFIVFVGPSGCGKTTLINLIPRFYDVTEGEILVDGVNVCEYKQEALFNKLGYVPQKAVMFNGSVKYNVSYGDCGKKITLDKVKEAVKIAQAYDFVMYKFTVILLSVAFE